MLQSIREKAQGWIAWAIVILISIPFALWGIQEYLGVGSEPVVATVEGQEITERSLDARYQEFRRQLRERLGGAFRPEMFDEKLMRREVLDQMIRSDVLLKASLSMGLNAGDNDVRNTIFQVPAFQKDGSFDRDTYDRAIRLQGLTSAGFEQQIRRSLITNQLSKAVEMTAFVTQMELAEAIRLRQQKREFSYVVVPLAEHQSDAEIADDVVKDYYDNHQSSFVSPEQVKIAYIELNSEQLGSKLSPSEDELRAYFEAQKAEFIEPERRRASHILITVAQDADAAEVDAARVKVVAGLERIRAGEDFAAVAKDISQDPGSAEAGGDLDYFERGIMDPAFEEVAFSQGIDVVSEPVRSQFGFHLIKVTAIKAVSPLAFEESKEDILNKYRTKETERLYYEYAERLADMVYESPDSLQPAAEALGLEIKHSDWFGRSGGQGILQTPKVTGAAFSEDVLQQRNNSDVIELTAGNAVVLRVESHQEESVKPLSDVRETILQSIRREQAAASTRETSEKMLAQLKAVEPLEQVAGEREIKEPGAVSRDDANVPAAVIREVFRLARPQTAASYGTAELANGDIAVIVLKSVKDGGLADLSEDQSKAEVTVLSRSRGRDDYEQVVMDLRSRADVEINLPQLEQ